MLWIELPNVAGSIGQYPRVMEKFWFALKINIHLHHRGCRLSAVDMASAHNYINVLDWFSCFQLQFKYSYCAMDHIAVLEWWKRSGFALKCTLIANSHMNRQWMLLLGSEQTTL